MHLNILRYKARFLSVLTDFFLLRNGLKIKSLSNVLYQQKKNIASFHKNGQISAENGFKITKLLIFVRFFNSNCFSLSFLT